MAIHEWIARGAVSDDIAKQRGYKELVRCKNCKYYEPDPYGEPGHGDCNGRCDSLPGVDDNFFCAEGERRTGP